MFIVFEGLDGSGTTTQVDRIAQKLRAQKIACLTTFEPSQGPIGVMIRQALRRRLMLPGGEALDHRSLALLFAADRIDHLRAVVEPALALEQVVISDRYVHSSLAYQGATLDQRWVDAINAQARTADLVIWLDVPVEECLRRMAVRGGERELFEAEATLRDVQQRYEQAIHLRPERVVRVDGTGSEEEVAARIESTLRATVLPHLAWIA